MGAAAITATRNEWSGLPFFDVVGRIQSRIDPSAPGNLAVVVRRRQLEVKRLPIGVQNHVKQEVLAYDLRSECQAVGGVAPVRLPELYTMPVSFRFSEELVEIE